MSRILLHIGCGKTATTTVQNGVFARHPDLHYLGRPYERTGVNPIWERIYDLIHFDDQLLDLEPYRQALTGERREAGVRPIVLSDEKMAAAPMPTLLAKRLAEVFGPATILITIRNQLTAVPSHFAQHGWELKGVPAPWNGKPVSFDNWLASARRDVRRTYLDSIDYDLLARAFETVFGKEAVQILTYEQLRAAPAEFAAGLAEILGVDADATGKMLAGARHENRRPAARASHYNRLRRLLPEGSLGRCVPGFVRRAFHGFLAGGKQLEVVLGDDHKAWLEEQYAAGNRDIAQRYNLDLKRLGYPL